MSKYNLKSEKEVEKIAEGLARNAEQKRDGAFVLALSGELGAGKTFFVKAIARSFGVREVVNSPTFLIMKKYKLNNERFSYLYHFDCYRVLNAKEIEALGWREIISKKDAFVAVEWPENIKSILPESHTRVEIQSPELKVRNIIIFNEKI